ncbi:MAG: T9SS type A sorting domain-containing protein [Bacteroidetes bacterium]|nr:T9SS type A sorting domain-containing protein [Bacteroidota bacterium]
MKSIIILLFSALITLSSVAQTPVFNKKIIFRDSLDYEFASQLAETNDGYLVAGTSHTWNKSYSNDTRLVVLKLSYDGTILRKKIYGDTLNWYSCPQSKALLNTGDGNFIILCQHFTSQFNYSTVLMKLNPDGDSIWTKTIYKQGVYEGQAFVTTFTQTSDKGFAILGQVGYPGIIIRTDSLCNVLWAKVVGENSIHAITEINSAASLPDNGILVGYYTYDAQSATVGSGVIMKADSAGNFKWWREIGTRPYNGTNQVFISVTKDTFILALATTAEIQNPQYKKFELMKLTTNNILISDAIIGPENQDLNMWGSTQLLDSTLIVCGSQGSNLGCVFNCTTGARELFYREYVTSAKVLEGHHLNGRQEIFSVLPTSDGGLLMAGYFSYSDSYDQDPWILKTDRYGCFQPGCDPEAIYITLQPSTQDVCKGDSALFSINSTGDSISIQWQMEANENWENLSDGAIFTGTRTDTLRLLKSGGMDKNSLIRCRLMNPKYTCYSHTAGLTILHAPSVTVEPEGQWVGVHSRAIFTINAAGSPPLIYQWFYKNMSVLVSTDSIFVIDPVDEEDALGPYHCVISNPCGQLSSRNVWLHLYGQGIGDDEQESSINIFPNPASSSVTISLSDPSQILTTLNIYTIRGEKIREVNFNRQTVLDISSLTSGLYILKFNSDGHIIHKRLMVY